MFCFSFFFFKQKTAYEMRISDWSSDVCSSDLAWRQGASLWRPFADVQLSLNGEGALRIQSPYLPNGHIEQTADGARLEADGRFELLGRLDRKIGRASCRERVCQYV